ncbi:MAG: ThiF family adenylyltransferase [Flavobacteriaceae bacterium]|nr:ThiF family adenylyltransferase [Flavobacteriaceae bacterium]MBL4568770.1 ThiF family adenylyltransferase [Flavobacteriaceae bacterium]
MSQKLINHNPDLKKLQNEGYEIEIIGSYLVMKKVPYVNMHKKVKFGTLVSELTMAGNNTSRPNTHVMYFAGEMPCDMNGRALTNIVNGQCSHTVEEGLTTQYSFSSKPACGYYLDYYEKFNTYSAMLCQYARAIRSSVTPKTFNVIETNDNEDVFKYMNTASSRAGINDITEKLKQNKVAIIGLGGTGSYVLDFIAKTPISEIHLYDDDVFLSHNAFRAPGCSSAAQLRRQYYKVTHYKKVYSMLHNGIVAHRKKVTSRNVRYLFDCDFVFICIDNNVARKIIAEKLVAFGIPFIDVGMGIEKCQSSLLGQVRTTYCNPAVNNKVPRGMPTAVNEGDDDLYSSNIQTVELNALNAVEAVIKWKKHCGFYLDLENENNSIYSVDGNHILNQGGE